MQVFSPSPDVPAPRNDTTKLPVESHSWFKLAENFSPHVHVCDQRYWHSDTPQTLNSGTEVHPIVKEEAFLDVNTENTELSVFPMLSNRKLMLMIVRDQLTKKVLQQTL